MGGICGGGIEAMLGGGIGISGLIIGSVFTISTSLVSSGTLMTCGDSVFTTYELFVGFASVFPDDELYTLPYPVPYVTFGRAT